MDSSIVHEHLAKKSMGEGCIPKLTFKERITYFCICWITGTCISVLASLSFFTAVTGDPSQFAILYTLGQIISILGFKFQLYLLILTRTGFLTGFRRQFKGMFKEKRMIASIVFLASMVMTLVSAIWLDNPALVLICVIIQFCAYIWYCASYVPFGRKILKKTCKCLFKV